MGGIARAGGERVVRFPAAEAVLEGNLVAPENAAGVVLFAHGSGSGRHSPRNRQVARTLQQGGLATFLIDLLSAEEEQTERRTLHLRFNIRLLADRLSGAIDWLALNPLTRGLRIGLFGASTGAAAALVTAAERPRDVAAVVSRGGRPDLAEDLLPNVKAPVLLLVGGNDAPVIRMNQKAFDMLGEEGRLRVIPGASHLFEEPGKLEEVAELSKEWFLKYLGSSTPPRPA